MRGLQSIIDTFSQEDSQEFVRFLDQKNRRGDAKNISLFKLIRSGKTEELDVLLYGKPAKNNFYGLCSRLQDSLIDFVASKSFSGETSQEMDILKLLLASRIFFEHKQYSIGFKTLYKAKEAAEALDLYSILNEVHQTLIQYAHQDPKQDLETILRQADENSRNFQQELRVTMAYAQIKQQLQHGSMTSVETIIDNAFRNHQIEIGPNLTYKSLYQLIHLCFSAARAHSDYYAMTPHIEKLYQMVHQKQHLTQKHRYYHIEILHLMAFTHFRNKNFERALEFANRMDTQLNASGGTYYKQFEDKLTLIRALALNYCEQADTAIRLLELSHSGNLDIQLTLAMCYFQQGQLEQAHGILSSFQHSNGWYEKKMGLLWVLKYNMMQLLLWIERNKLEIFLVRLRSFERNFFHRLKAMGEHRVLAFMKLVNAYYENPKAVTSEQFKQQVEASFEWIGPQREDIFVMSFYAWLKSKMDQTPLYQTTLQLVRMADQPTD